MSSVDVAWRDGYEQGMQASQNDQAQQQAQQAQEATMAAQQPGQPGQEGQEGEQPQPGAEDAEQQPISQNPNGDDELGQHIEKLENILGKSELSPFVMQDLKKAIDEMRTLTIPARVKANVPEAGLKALTLQEKIVKDVFAKWEGDQTKAASDISSILNVEGLTKK